MCLFWARDTTLAVHSVSGWTEARRFKVHTSGPIVLFGEDCFVEADVTEVFLVFSRV